MTASFRAPRPSPPRQQPAKDRGASTEPLRKVTAVSVSQQRHFCVTAQDTMQTRCSARLELPSEPSRFSLTESLGPSEDQ